MTQEMDYTKLNGLVPAVVQDAQSKTVLMVGFMNREALDKTKQTGKVTFFSRSKNRLWTKGEESGNYLELVDILPDCDRDTLLVKANPAGPVCHLGTDTCFAETNRESLYFLAFLQDLIEERKKEMPENSYTTRLFRKGINKIIQKLGEEAVELIIESKDQDEQKFINEAADLIYHLLVLLTEKGFRIEDVAGILAERHRVP